MRQLQEFVSIDSCSVRRKIAKEKAGVSKNQILQKINFFNLMVRSFATLDRNNASVQQNVVSDCERLECTRTAEHEKLFG